MRQIRAVSDACTELLEMQCLKGADSRLHRVTLDAAQLLLDETRAFQKVYAAVLQEKRLPSGLEEETGVHYR